MDSEGTVWLADFLQDLGGLKYVYLRDLGGPKVFLQDLSGFFEGFVLEIDFYGVLRFIKIDFDGI